MCHLGNVSLTSVSHSVKWGWRELWALRKTMYLKALDNTRSSRERKVVIIECGQPHWPGFVQHNPSIGPFLRSTAYGLIDFWLWDLSFPSARFLAVYFCCSPIRPLEVQGLWILFLLHSLPIVLNSMSPWSLHSVITTQIYGTRFTAHVLCLTVYKSISQALPHSISSRLPWAFLVLRSRWLGDGQSKSCSGFSIKPVLWYLSHFSLPPPSSL